MRVGWGLVTAQKLKLVVGPRDYTLVDSKQVVEEELKGLVNRVGFKVTCI